MARAGWTLLVLTVASCTVAGALFVDGYEDDPVGWDALRSPRDLELGLLLYALPLVGVLGIHEIAHYVVMRRAGLKPSFPYFLPVPPPLTLTGTFGAVIALREPVRGRRTLLLVGASGPIVGFAAAFGVMLVGLALSGPAPPGADAAGVTLQTPLVYDVMARVLGVPDDARVHPLAFAGWLGLLLTAVQLLPAGQLDGGHIARALLGERARWLGWGVVAALAVLGLWFPGWWILAILVAWMQLGMPPAETGTIGWSEWTLGALCLAVFIVCFVPVPLAA